MNVSCEPCMDEVMTPNPVSIESESPISEAKYLMKELGVRHLPVTTRGIVDSLVNERDIQHFSTFGHHYQGEDQLLLKDICFSRIRLADVNDPLGKVLSVMTKENLDAVILLRNGEMAGIFTESDACRIMAKHMGYQV